MLVMFLFSAVHFTRILLDLPVSTVIVGQIRFGGEKYDKGGVSIIIRWIFPLS